MLTNTRLIDRLTRYSNDFVIDNIIKVRINVNK